MASVHNRNLQHTQHRIILHICKIMQVLQVVRDCLTLNIMLLRKRFGSQARKPTSFSPPSLQVSGHFLEKDSADFTLLAFKQSHNKCKRKPWGERQRPATDFQISNPYSKSSEIISNMRCPCKNCSETQCSFFFTPYTLQQSSLKYHIPSLPFGL